MAELAYAYAGITKSEKHADGTITVYGKATDDSLDVDKQICDDGWLKKAMPDWFTSGGNIREQHSSIAAGVATDYEAKSDGHYITAHIVDPTSVKKIEAGVLKGFSIGIRGPRVIRDEKAAGGRIVDGQIVEISVVDRPANSNAKMTIAKTVAGELASVEQVLEETVVVPSPADVANKFNENHDEGGRFTSSDGGSNSLSASKKDNDLQSDLQTHLDTLTVLAAFNDPKVKSDASQVANLVQSAKEKLANTPLNHDGVANIVSAAGDIASARTLANNSNAMTLNTMGRVGLQQSYENLMSLANTAMGTLGTKSNDADIVKSESEAIVTDATETIEAEAIETPDEEAIAEPAVESNEIVEAAKSLIATLNKFDQGYYDTAMGAIADLIVVEAGEMKAGSDERESIKELLRAAKHLACWYEGEAEEGEVPGVGGMIDLDDLMADKSADAEPEKVDEILTKADDAEEPTTAELNLLKSALAVEKEKAVQLEAELEIAKNAVVSGGPKRAAIALKSDTSTLLVEATKYLAKAEQTSDKYLAEGYREIAADLQKQAKKGTK